MTASIPTLPQQIKIENIENIEKIEVAEQSKSFWDAQGLDTDIAVRRDSQLVLATRHWATHHYIDTQLSPTEIWKHIETICKHIGRNFTPSQNGPYVYINNLNVSQTQDLFNLFTKTFGGNNITRVWELSWEIDDAVLPHHQ